MSPPTPQEPAYQMTNAELAEAIEYARASLGKVPGNDTAVITKLRQQLFGLLDVQLARAKAESV